MRPGTSAASSQAQVTTPAADTQAPSAPTNLLATPEPHGKVLLTCDASSDNNTVTGYQILRSTTGDTGPWSVIATTTNLSFTTRVPQGGAWYEVKAVDPAGNVSDPSNVVFAASTRV